MSFDFKKDPIDNFLELYKAAQIKGVPEANAMALATVNSENQPSVRIVFFKGIHHKEKDKVRGFSFYTNYDGRKARDIENNNKVSANFFWPQLDQQVRIEGLVERLSRQESENYFSTRPRTSQIGAWASQQSEEIESFDTLIKKTEHFENKFRGGSVPCPPQWGGYWINSTEIEFWFGRAGRLHERYVYQKISSSDNVWSRLLRSP